MRLAHEHPVRILWPCNRVPQWPHFDPIDSWDEQQKGKLAKSGNEDSIKGFIFFGKCFLSLYNSQGSGII